RWANRCGRRIDDDRGSVARLRCGRVLYRPRPVARGTVSSMATKWKMSGSLLGECNCYWGCPCSFDAPPSHGSCCGVYTWIIDKGAYGDVKLDGLGVALPGIWPGAVHSLCSRPSRHAGSTRSSRHSTSR